MKRCECCGQEIPEGSVQMGDALWLARGAVVSIRGPDDIEYQPLGHLLDLRGTMLDESDPDSPVEIPIVVAPPEELR